MPNWRAVADEYITVQLTQPPIQHLQKVYFHRPAIKSINGLISDLADILGKPTFTFRATIIYEHTYKGFVCDSDLRRSRVAAAVGRHEVELLYEKSGVDLVARNPYAHKKEYEGKVTVALRDMRKKAVEKSRRDGQDVDEEALMQVGPPEEAGGVEQREAMVICD
jgi:hypothetical protein